MERRKFTQEFKLEAVPLIRDRGVLYTRQSTCLRRDGSAAWCISTGTSSATCRRPRSGR